MKELRFRLDGLWRFAFAFDPDRSAIVLVGGNKTERTSRASTAISSEPPIAGLRSTLRA